MASDLSTNSGRSYGAINSSTQEDTTNNDGVHPILVLYREVRSGKQRIGLVFMYSLVAVMGAMFNGLMLGFTAVLSINMSKHSYPSVSTDMFQYIGVS